MLPGLTPWGEPDAEVARAAARAWSAGGIVGLPTETVYGLAADAQDPAAVARVYRAKGRPADHPLIVHVQAAAALEGWAAAPNSAAQALAEAFWPGPLTVIVARSERAGDHLTGGQSTVALRCPNHPVALACIGALVALTGDPARGVAAPSANRFGRVSPTRAADVVAEVGDRLDPTRDLVVDGGRCEVGVESTIVDCTSSPARVLRLGAISQAQVDAVLDRADATPAAGSRTSGLGATAAASARPGAGGSGPASRFTSGGPGPVPRDATPTAGPELHDATSAAGAEPHDATSAAAPRAGGATHQLPRVPGTLESHYAPAARVRLVAAVDLAADGELTEGSAVGLIAETDVPTPTGWVRLLAADSAGQYAREVYRALRRADELGLTDVVAVPPEAGSGALAEAVRDRLTRASAAQGLTRPPGRDPRTHKAPVPPPGHPAA